MPTFFSPTIPKRLGPRFDKLEHPIYHAVIFPLTHDGHYLERVTRWHRTLHQLRTLSLFPHSLSQCALTSPSYPALISTPYLFNKELFMQPTHNIFSFLSAPPFQTNKHISPSLLTGTPESSLSPSLPPSQPPPLAHTRVSPAQLAMAITSILVPVQLINPHPLAPQPAPPATNNGAKCAIQFPNDRSRQGNAISGQSYALQVMSNLMPCKSCPSICKSWVLERLSAALRMEISAFRKLCFHCGDKVCGEGA